MKYTNPELHAKLYDRDSDISHEIKVKCFPMILDMVKKHSGQKEDAEDILQQALLITILRCDKGLITLSCSFRTFLMAICSNLWKDTLKSKRYFRRYQDSLSLTEPVYFITYSPDSALLQKAFQDKCALLTEKKRKVLEMHLAGLPQKEIAASMRTSHAYIRKIIHDIKNDIKQSVLNDPVASRLVDEYILNK